MTVAVFHTYMIETAGTSVMSAEDMCVYGGSGLNYCMLRIALDTFASAGMAEQSADAGEVRLIPVSTKTDLMASGFLAELRRTFGIQ